MPAGSGGVSSIQRSQRSAASAQARAHRATLASVAGRATSMASGPRWRRSSPGGGGRGAPRLRMASAQASASGVKKACGDGARAAWVRRPPGARALARRRARSRGGSTHAIMQPARSRRERT